MWPTVLYSPVEVIRQDDTKEAEAFRTALRLAWCHGTGPDIGIDVERTINL